MNTLSCKSIKGIGKYNNDIMNCINNFCYVMDGASSVFNDNLFYKTSDLYEYMNLLKENVSDVGIIEENLKEGIKESNKLLNGLNQYNDYELPTFTIAAVKENKSDYELYLLCDCLISILYNDGKIENIEDHRFDSIKNKCRKEIAEIDNLKLSIEEKFQLKRKIWRKYRKFANAINGYPVGSTNPNSIKSGIIKKINKKDVNKIIICTDGLYSSIGIPSDETYFEETVLSKKISNINNNDDLTYILIEANSAKTVK